VGAFLPLESFGAGHVGISGILFLEPFQQHLSFQAQHSLFTPSYSSKFRRESSSPIQGLIYEGFPVPFFHLLALRFSNLHRPLFEQ